MNKNIVFMTAAKVQGQETRSKPYEYGISSFKKWCDKNNCDLFVLDTPLFDHSEMKINFHRYYCFDLLENSGVEYNQILLTDADAIIHPDCPNFFEMSENKYTVTRCDGSFDWICRSKENYEKYFNNGVSNYKLWDYFNSGFQIVNKSHKEFFKQFIELYWNNVQLVKWVQDNYGVGTDQALLNYFAHTQNIETKYLPYQYCMADLTLKNLLAEDMLYLRIPGIYQFNAIPDNNGADRTLYWMEKTYNYLYGK